MPRGRPTKLTPESQKRICDALRIGSTYELAAQYGGVDYRTFLNWMQRGETASSGIYFQFFQEVKKAEADGAMKWLALIDKAAVEDGQWQAAAWKLERRYPRDYGRSVQEVQHSGEITHQVFSHRAAVAAIEARSTSYHKPPRDDKSGGDG